MGLQRRPTETRHDGSKREKARVPSVRRNRPIAAEDEAVSSYEVPAPTTRTESVTSQEGTRTASATGYDVVRYARTFKGTPYGPYPDGGGLAYCKPYKLMDCSCLTRTAFLKFGKTLPDSPALQYRYGRSVAKTALRPGDLLFYSEYGGKITSVRIYSGKNRYTGQPMVVHASNYFGKVVESEMRYLRGYVGAKRIL